MAGVVKVTLNEDTLIDISDSTVDSSKVLSSYIGYEGDGDRFVGAYTPPPSVTIVPLSIDQNGTYEAPSSNVAYNPIDVSVPTVTTQSLSVTSNGTYTAPTGTAYTPVTVNVSGGGGSSEGGVKFIDYDGTVLHEYTVDEFSELSALPANPTHTGLTSQGWNWTKAQIDSQIEDYPEMPVIVGQMYITDDGKTRIYCSLDGELRSPHVFLGVSGVVTIDWGDESSTSTLNGSSTGILINTSHTYANAGDYIITLSVGSSSQARIFASNSSSGSTLLTETSNSSVLNSIYQASIKKIEIGNRIDVYNHAFYNCYNLTSITIPSTVTTIGTNAFYNCYSLSSATIPSTVTSIGNSAFNTCFNLSSITIPSTVTTIGGSAFYDCRIIETITIPSTVTTIGGSAFQNCYNLSPIIIPEGVTSIGSNAFYNCYSLSSITIPSTVTSIGSSAFQTCYNLSSPITIPEGVTNIGSYTFQSCFNLSSITIPSTVTRIDNSAFNNCSNLSSINIPEGVTTIGTYVFTGCYNLSSITIPEGVTSIGNNVFSGCRRMKTITIPSTVTSIGNNAFNSCYSLSSINIPEGVTSIGNNVFQYCYNLSSITIPSTVTSIGTYAFNSSAIVIFHILPTTPPTLANTNAFSLFGGCIIYVPAESLEAYQTATNWSTYASYMQGE